MYKTINGWTKQSMIEHIKKEFKGKSISLDGERCLYRGPDGKKCAVGMFIPDNKYRSEMDGTAIQNGYSVWNIEKACQDDMPLSADALGYLQSEHDLSGASETLGTILEWIEENVEA